MNFIRLLPVILSLLLLGAHYYRAGFIPVVAIMGAGVLMLLIRRPWAARIVQILLCVGGIEWIRTTFGLVMMRQSMGMPWVRLALILGGVALLSFCSVFIFRAGSVRRRYKLD
jgi:hypothetical protein